MDSIIPNRHKNGSTGWRVVKITATSGMPQGSVLGPLLLLLCVNDLPENIQSQDRLFADDKAVFLTVSNMQASQVLQSDLKALQRWERSWDMEFDPDLHMTRSKTLVKSIYYMHKQKLESVDAAKNGRDHQQRPELENTHIHYFLLT